MRYRRNRFSNPTLPKTAQRRLVDSIPIMTGAQNRYPPKNVGSEVKFLFVFESVTSNHSDMVLSMFHSLCPARSQDITIYSSGTCCFHKLSITVLNLVFTIS